MKRMFFFLGGGAGIEQLFCLTIGIATCLCAVLCVLCLVTQSGLILYDPMDCSSPSSSVHGNSSDKNTGVGCHAFLQGIFLTEGSNPVLPGGFFTV